MICFDKSISDRKGRSRLFPRLFLLGFLLYGLNAAAQEPDSVLSAKASKSTRQKTSVLASEKQDTVVFRFAPKRRMFWADYKGNAAAINSLTQSIRQHKLSIESGDMKVRMLGFCSSYDSFNLKSATKLFSVLLASKRPLITELADKLRLKYPLLPTISPCPTMRLEAIRSIIPISCRRYPKSV